MKREYNGTMASQESLLGIRVEIVYELLRFVGENATEKWSLRSLCSCLKTLNGWNTFETKKCLILIVTCSGFLKCGYPQDIHLNRIFQWKKPSILEIPHGHHHLQIGVAWDRDHPKDPPWNHASNPNARTRCAYAETIDQEASLRPTGEIPVLVTQFLFTQHLWFASPRLNKYYCILIYTNHTTLDRKWSK